MRLEACGVCHTDLYTASGADPTGYAPCVLGHEGAGVVEKVGEGVTMVAPGDHVVTLFAPECGECIHCRSPRTNRCIAIRDMQGRGYLPDGTTRLHRDGEPLRHFMGTSTFAEYTVMPEIALAKVSPEAPLDGCALFACGLSTGLGAAMYTADVQPGSVVRGVRLRPRRPRRRRGCPDPGRGADHRRRPGRQPAEDGGRPRRDGHHGRRRRRGRPHQGADGRLRRRLHVRGDGQREGHAPGRRGGARGVGRGDDDRRRRQGRDPRHRPAPADHGPPRDRLVVRRRQGPHAGAAAHRPLAGRRRRRAVARLAPHHARRGEPRLRADGAPGRHRSVITF